MNRLDSKNKKLREQHPEKAKRVDAETEAQGDAARLTEQLKVYEEQLARIRGTLTDIEKRATEAEEMAANAEERVAESGRKAWDLARRSVGKAQKRQKVSYDKHTRPPNFAVGERVFLLKPAEMTGASRKFARPFHGPYRITDMQANDAYIRRVDRPQEEPILVALQRLRRCSDEIPDEFWPPAKSKKSTGSNVTRVTSQDQPPLPSAEDAVIPESPKRS